MNRKLKYKMIPLFLLCFLMLFTMKLTAGEKQPMPSAVFDASNLSLSQLRVGIAFSFDGGSNWSLIQDSWMNTITLTDDQVNNALAHGILVKMTGDNINTYDSDVLCIVLDKANSPSNIQAVAPTDSGNSGKIINVNNSMQYKKDSDSSWTNINDSTVSNLSPGKYQVRTKGAGTTIASNSIDVNISNYDPTHGLPRQATPGANFDARTMTLSGVLGVNYSVNGGNNWTSSGSDSVILNLADLHTDQGIKLYRPGNNSSNSDSEIQTIGLNKATPPVGISAVSASASSQGIINGLSPQMEYMAEGASSWTNIASYSISVPAGTYFIRTQGAYTTLPSDAVEVIIDVDASPAEDITGTVTKEDDAINDVDNSTATENVKEADAPDHFVPSDATGPSIVGNSGIRGWDAITANITEAPVVLNMNGTTVVTKEALEKIRDMNSELILGMENQIMWTIQGSSVVNPEQDIDLAVNQNDATIPDAALQTLETDGGSYHQFTLAHNGTFGFSAALSIPIDTKTAGEYANLFYYHPDSGSLDYVDTCMIDSKGNASFLLNHASSYVVTVNRTKYTGGISKESTDSAAVKRPAEIVHTEKKAPMKSILVFAGIILVSVIFIIIVLKNSSGQKKKKKKKQRR